MICGECSKSKQTKSDTRIPHGWKRHQGKAWCSECWNLNYMLRAITIPVVSPLDASWDELRQALKVMWKQTTSASNWMVRQLAMADVIRKPDDEKMPAMPRTYLYPDARLQFPSLPPQSVVSIEQSVTRKYRARRYEAIWLCSSSLPSYRYPQPFPVHNQSWSIITSEDGRPTVSVRIAERKYGLRLMGGWRYQRQLCSLAAMKSGTALPGELSLYESGNQLMCKMVAWLPRKIYGSRNGTLRVLTDKTALLVAVNAKDERLWVCNSDQIPRWVAEHRKQLQRWSEDQKAENRPVANFAERRREAVERFHNRMQSAVQQSARYIVGYASRRNFADIHYNDQERSFSPEFPWAALRSRIETLCDEEGINIVVASDASVRESGEALAEQEDE